MPSEASRSRPVALILAATALLAVLIALWPGWTLRYIHALAWPLVTSFLERTVWRADTVIE